MGVLARAGLARWWGIFGLAIGCCCGEPLLPKGATVILISGLPGDIESETAFRDQLQTLLPIVRERAGTNLLVLCDDPKTFGTATSGFKVMKGDRAAFLGLRGSLAGSTNSLVLMAWGHGGSQSGNPVFHVRGARITPADFEQLVSSAEAPVCTCVLLFRGSGAFGRQLASEKRNVLTSDCESRFDSDPVAMDCFLGALRSQPGADIKRIADDLGRRVVAWYAERHLARTEEPTLWAAGPTFRLLAPEAAEPTAPAPEKSDPPAAVARAEPAGDKPETKPEAASEELPAFWKELRKVNAEEYPEDEAVVLRRSISYTIARQPALSAEQEQFIQILTPEGKSAGDFDISYSPPSEEVEFLDCEVLSPEGKLSRLDPESIREASEESVGDYQVGRRKIFSLPGVVPGAVLHVRYRSQFRNFPLPSVSIEIPIAAEVPARQCTLRVSVPKESPFHFAFERVEAKAPVISSSSYGTTYTWHLEHVPAYQREVLVPPRQRSRLLISTFPNWSDFAEWYGRMIRLADEVTPELEVKAKELTRHARTDHERVLAVYNYVTALRYVAVPIGVNSFRPHAAANVFRNGFGDCKDKANLFNALLRAVKIDAHLVLVPRFSQAHDSIPGLAFNHAISCVTLDGAPLWVDTTDDVCRFGMLPPGDSGRKVLVIDGHSSSLTQLPQPDSANHQLKLTGQVNCAASSGDPEVTLTAETRGFPDYELRSTARQAHDYGTSVPLLAASFRPVAGAFALASQRASGVSSLDENFSWRAKGSFVGLTTTSREQTFVHAPFWLPREWDMALHSRHSPLFLNQGYPLVLDQHFEVILPERAAGLQLPVLAENTSPPLKWRLEWKPVTAGKLMAVLKAELVQGDLDGTQTGVFQRQLRSLLAAVSADASFRRTP